MNEGSWDITYNYLPSFLICQLHMTSLWPLVIQLVSWFCLIHILPLGSPVSVSSCF